MEPRPYQVRAHGAVFDELAQNRWQPTERMFANPVLQRRERPQEVARVA